MSKTEIRDEAPKRKYFTEIPNMIDDMRLSVYAVRLYLHMKRITGEKPDGVCWQSSPNMAKHCGMSESKLSHVKRELESAGLITIREVPSGRGRKAHNITIKDIWAQNIRNYADNLSQAPLISPGEINISPSEIKKNLSIKSQSINSAENVFKKTNSVDTTALKGRLETVIYGSNPNNKIYIVRRGDKCYIVRPEPSEMKNWIQKHENNQPALAG